MSLAALDYSGAKNREPIIASFSCMQFSVLCFSCNTLVCLSEPGVRVNYVQARLVSSVRVFCSDGTWRT
jgi:hypothetical protein